MRHTIHIFIGEEMVSIAESISKHLLLHGERGIADYAHVVSWKTKNNVTTSRRLGKSHSKFDISNDQEGAFYFANLHSETIAIGADPTFGAELYVCIYVRLFEEDILSEIERIISFTKDSGKDYLIDVYGLSDDAAKAFCNGESEIRELISKGADYSKIAKTNNKQLISYNSKERIHRFLLLQDCNLRGIGLNLDKNTLIRIWGEYALLTTEQFSDLYPLSDFTKPDVTAFGISALWFDKYFFTEYLLSQSYLYIMEREKIGQHKMENPADLLKKAKKYIGQNRSVLSTFYDDVIIPKLKAEVGDVKTVIQDDFRDRLQNLENIFMSVMSDETLSLPEKRAMLALFIREDDELFDENVLMDELPTIDDCFEESLSLYVKEEKLYEEDGNSPVLTGPRDEDDKIYLPLDELKHRKADVRKSQGFIRNCAKRLKEIEESVNITHISKKRLTEEGFKFGDDVFKLQHDIVEQPLAETYIPTGTPAKSIDLRNGFSPIRNQGHLGACAAFSSTSVFEYILNEGDNSSKHVLSPRFLYYNLCKKNIDGTPIDSGSSLYANVESLGEAGVCFEDMCPYEDDFNTPPTEDAKSDALSHLVTEAKNVNVNHIDLTAALSEGYPIIISLKVYDSFGAGPDGFVFRPTDEELRSTDYGYHAMVVCGYNEDKKVYIVRNSWGTGFGSKGYCYIPFSYIEDSSLCRQACIFTGVSCSDITVEKFTQGDVNFDETSPTIEYAIVRIAMEEEKQNLIKLEEKYNNLNAEYMLLIRELCNQLKRDALTKHAIDRLTANVNDVISKDDNIPVIQNKSIPKFGSSKWIAPLGILCLAGVTGCFNLIAGGILSVVAIALFVWMNNAKQEKIIEDSPIHVKPHVKALPYSREMARKLQFMCAGMAIDKLSDFRDELTKTHRYLTSYIDNFEIWQQEEKKLFYGYDDNLKPPFITVLTKKEFVTVFDMKKDIYTQDVWLWKEFAEFEPSEEVIRDFKTRLRNKLRQRIEKSYTEFSMCKFMMDNTSYPYLLPTPSKKCNWLENIQQQSIPFVDIQGTMPNSRNVLIVKAEDLSESEAWNHFVTNNYVEIPSSAFGGSPFKLTYIQIQGLKAQNVKSLM